LKPKSLSLDGAKFLVYLREKIAAEEGKEEKGKQILWQEFYFNYIG
jgi:hypothetical protein